MNYKSYKDQAEALIRAKMLEATENIVLNSERNIKKAFTDFPDPPIDTGTLRRSITGTVLKKNKDSIEGEVRASTLRTITVTNINSKRKKKQKEVEYAKYVEYGTVKMPARPFMRNGMIKAKQSNESIIKRIFFKK